jgi:hypothetical protein
MPTKLTYPKLPDGYGWNLSNKIRMKIGYKNYISSNANTNTYIHFPDNDLTQDEIDQVDAIMADPNTAQDPIQSTIEENAYHIKDIWDWRSELETTTGINFAIGYYSSGQFGPNVQDMIILVPMDENYENEIELTNPQKNTVANTIRSQMGGWQ